MYKSQQKAQQMLGCEYKILRFVTKLCGIQTARALTHKVPGPLDVLDPLVGAELRRGVPRAHLLAP